ncbi:isochorismatase family protein [Parapedobacter sp. ISTM3]|uniref:isochorismatase family protein n=1 Tax=Parapedobacter sp. ISTM3 TaxID=2800130 RepID=UPI001908D133|nr:isochorismatase family protein [Parapedobacter sp. ISTM3]MBK1439625.1 isochorismatase family protein [Parapedobacter sp. ISTM3]
MTNNNLEQDKSALLIIDMQYDFASPQGQAYVHGTEEIIPHLVSLTRIFRKYGRPVFHIMRLYYPDGSNAELCRRALISSGKQIVAPDSQGAEIIDELLPETDSPYAHDELLKGKVIRCGDNDYILYKPRWGAFYNTTLHDVLQSNGITSLFVAGCNFPNCPRTTMYEASERDYKLAMIPSAISGVYDRGLEEMQNIGIHIFDDLALVDFFFKSGTLITDYHPVYKDAFKTLNMAWLNQYFDIEPVDEYVLSNPEEAILKNGGKILFALKGGQPIGTAALKKMDDGRLELTKMTVHENHRGCGIGKMLCTQAISVSKRLGVKELVLFSHTRLADALNIYRKLGFNETEIDKTKYKRADVMMKLTF